ncbi:MAG: hypothetical protein ABSD74_09300 [Rhizomicrobium sp.]|jgi:hypothetical protein
MHDFTPVWALIAALIVLYAFRNRILAWLRRFDQRNTLRRLEELRDRRDNLAHFRHTLRLAEEQVEDIGELIAPDARTGTPVTLYLFEGERYLSRDDAEAARNEVVIARARAFYEELPKALAERRDGKLRQ